MTIFGLALEKLNIPIKGHKTQIINKFSEKTDNKDIILAKDSQKENDFVHLIGLSGDGYLIHNVSGVWSDQA